MEQAPEKVRIVLDTGKAAGFSRKLFNMYVDTVIENSHGEAPLSPGLRGMARGSTGPNVSELKSQIEAISRKYLACGSSARGMEAAVVATRELNAPLYLHELIKRVHVLAMDLGEKEMKRASKLVARLHEEGLLSDAVARMGCSRLGL